MSVQTADNVLSTMKEDGSRRWIRPRLSHGRYLVSRRIVAYGLMALFFGLPFIRIHGKPAILLDIVHRRFTLLGYTFLPTDTILLAFTMLFIFVSIFLFTALFGRFWCGWACPQTVYMEFLYRPLERLFQGTAGRGGEPRNVTWGKGAYFVVAIFVTVIPAHTFLAYFVGVDALAHWMRQSPLEHPTAFLVMAATVFFMMFDFYWFREQLCIIACPYGRFQSVLLDKWSRIVSYDRRRGEPRGKLRGVSLPLASETAATGDCIDCRMCVSTCPTGIDIREGLQMECVNCAQCMDACDAVMRRIGKPEGLIRYSSQAAIQGESASRFRPRLLFYPLLLCALATAWVFVFTGKGTADVTMLRNFGNPFTRLASGEVATPVRLKITNRGEQEATFTVSIDGASGAHFASAETSATIGPDDARTLALEVVVPANGFHLGVCESTLHITNNRDFSRDLSVQLLGPFTMAQESDHDHH